MRLSELYTGLGAALSAVVAVLCCISPLILIALGFGSVVAAATLMRFQWLFVAVGAIAVFVSFLRYRRRKRMYALKGRTMPARLFTVALLYFSTVIIFRPSPSGSYSPN